MSENTALKRYLVSCASLGIAGVCTAPFDVVKTRLQTQTMQRAASASSASSAASPAPLGMFGMARHIWVTESPAALMKGTVAMLGRMLTHGALRMSLYEPVKDGLLGLVAVDSGSTSGSGSQPPLSPAAMFGVKIVAGACSGAFAALASNPMEMLKVRSQTERSNISTWALLRKILATEGLVAMWSAGVTASMQRSALLNIGQLAVYDQIKSAICSFGVDADAKRNQIGASVLAGAVTSLITNPIDVIKTRLMFQQKAAPSAVSSAAVSAAAALPVRYRGTIHCFKSTVQSEGWRALFKGLLPNFSRQGPQTVIALFVAENLRKWLDIPAI